MINVIHDLPPRWVIFLVGVLGAMTAYYWAWQFLQRWFT